MRINRRSPVPWLLGAVTLIALARALSQPETALVFDIPISLLLIGLVALFVNIEVPLAGDSIGFDYAAGLLVYLSLTQHNNIPDAYGVIFVGAVIGGMIQAERHSRNSGRGSASGQRLVAWALVIAAQAVLSMMAGSLAYRLVGGRLSLEDALRLSDVLSLAVLILVSMAVYLGIYGLSLWWRGLRPLEVFRHSILTIALTLVGPITFVVGAALIFSSSLGGFILLMIGIVGLAIGTTAMGHGQLRYRDQVVELQSLSAVNSVMQTHLELGVLLDTIREQIEKLLDVRSFTLALCDQNRNMISFPMAIRNGRPVELAPRELDTNLLGYVIRTKTPLRLVQNPAARAKEMGLLPPDDNPTAWLGIPLLTPGHALGCIAVTLDDPHRSFTERDQRLLEALATQSSIAIENALLYQEAQQRASQLARLNSLSTQLSGTLDPLQVLDVVSRATLDVADATGAAVFLRSDSDPDFMVLAQSAGLSNHFIQDAPLPLNIGNTGDPLFVQNARLDPRAGGIFDLMRREQINAWIELPLVQGDNALGILVAYYHVQRPFTSDEIELLKMFANQVALAINNARLYRQTDDALDQRVEQLSALTAINKELSSTLNLNNIFRLVLERAIEATHSTQGALLLRDETHREPRLVARLGFDKFKTSDIIEINTVNQTYSTGQSNVQRDTTASGETIIRLSVPIVRDYDILGVIYLESLSPNVFTPDAVSFVTQLATQATIAIDNVHIFEWLQDSRNRLQVILDSMHEAMLMFELDGRIALANPRVLDLLGLDPGVIVGNKAQTLMARTELMFAERLGFEPEALRARLEVLEVGIWKDEGRFSYRLEKPTVRFLNRTIVAVSDQSSKVMGLLMVFTDATEERELAQAREDISRMIVHDLRSPLTAINASMKLLGEIVASDEAVGRSIQRTVDVSQRALRKLLHLIDSLLDIAKIESGTINLEIKDTDLRSLAENVRLELSPLAEELNINVQIDVPQDIPPLAIDSDKIERVLLNLVDNALKYAPLDGIIQIRARHDSGDGEERIRVEVTDNGPGVPDDDKERIFDRFQQVDSGKSHRRGTGLGLTFCRLTVQAHHGRIWIEDNPDGGSIFAFTLPITVEPQGER